MLIRLIFFYLCSCHLLAFLHSLFLFVLHILYTVVNSNAMNGWSASDTLKTVLPWWQTAIYALIAVLAVLTVLCAWQLSKALKRKKELADTAPAVDQK